MLRVFKGYFRAEGARCGIGGRRNIADRTLDRFSGDQLHVGSHACRHLTDIAFGYLPDEQHRVGIHDRHADIAHFQHAAGFGDRVDDDAGRIGMDFGPAEFPLGLRQHGLGRVERRLHRIELVFGGKALVHELEIGFVFGLRLVELRLSLGDARLAHTRFELAHQIAGLDLIAFVHKALFEHARGFRLDRDGRVGCCASAYLHRFDAVFRQQRHIANLEQLAGTRGLAVDDSRRFLAGLRLAADIKRACRHPSGDAGCNEQCDDV